jgi:hypothetical protein
MTQYFNILDLEPLEDILDSLVFEEEPSIFTDEYAVEFVETAFHLMEEFMIENPTIVSDPDFHDILLEEMKEMCFVQMEDHIFENDYIEDDMNELIEDAFNIFITTFHTERSTESSSNTNETNDKDQRFNVMDDKERELIASKIQGLREIPQPVQRTPEWYKFRWNLITASNAWKAFESQSNINQLIYEKCQPLQNFDLDDSTIEDSPLINKSEIKTVNINSALHWGQKYEPLSVMIYENLYNSKVEDFGCIQHPIHKFLGASPDGIVIESDTGRYGYMLEIKNPVTREITGIPKKEYWVQMQLQMEVCDLDKCDFLETKFVEYPDFLSYRNDASTAFNPNDSNQFNSFVTTSDGNYKGIMIYFNTKEGKPFYAYMPLTVWLPQDVEKWEEETIQTYQSEPYNYTFMKFIYWRLDKMSCVLVLRNKEWFKNNIRQLEKVWKTIEEERITGYQHRAPKRSTKKDYPSVKPYFKSLSQNNDEVCFLKVIKMGTQPEET